MGFLATTPCQEVADEFLKFAQQPLLWVIHVDKKEKCWHVNYMDESQFMDSEAIPSEKEFLFSPFSVFTVRAVHWQENATAGVPHRIELDVHYDNKLAPETLPLAPWQ